MKKILFAAIVLLSYEFTIAQTPEDALRYSWQPASGTARSQAIGNANGAIGGEISTMFSNPANMGFYKTGDFVISAGANIMGNNTTYHGQSTKATNASGFLGTTGVVFGRPSYSNGSVKSSAFGIAVNKLADFNNNVEYLTRTGVNTSMADMFLQDARVRGFGNLDQYGSWLAYQTYWIDTGATKQTFFSEASDAARASGLQQRQNIITSGGISEVAIAGALNLNEKVFLGATLGLPIVQYRATRQYTEQVPNSIPRTDGRFDLGYFEDNLSQTGMGINLKAGIVVKATENFRLGFAGHTPTFYSFSENYNAMAETEFVNIDDPSKVDYYKETSGRDGAFDYRLNTPYKLIGSFSYFLGNVNDVESQKGFISGDVEYVNHAASKFRTTGDAYAEDRDYFNDLNTTIKNDAYKGAVNARLGAELKFNTFMARLGGAYYGNPYRDIAGETGQIVQASTGFGYRHKGFFVDLGYVHTFGKDVVFPYRLESPLSVNPASINRSNSRILLTLGFKI